jgi:hypothetical protein
VQVAGAGRAGMRGRGAGRGGALGHWGGSSNDEVMRFLTAVPHRAHLDSKLRNEGQPAASTPRS